MPVPFQGFELLLRPETEDLLPSIAVPFDPPVTWEDAARVANRFLSAFAWMQAGTARVEEAMTSGGGFPIRLGKSPWHPKTVRFTSPNHKLRLDHLQEGTDEKSWLGLAFYREAVNLNSDPYRFLAFSKILNILADKGPQQVEWIRNALPQVATTLAAPRLEELGAEGCTDIPAYLYASGRCAVAHAYAQPLIDPDDPGDLLRLRKDLPVIRALAEFAIEHDLGVKSRRTVYHEHLYYLMGFRALLGPALVSRLKTDDSLPAEDLPTWPKLSLRFRDEPLFPAFEGLPTVAARVEKGAVTLQLRSADALVGAQLVLDFRHETMHCDFEHWIDLGDDGSPKAVSNALDHIRLLECCVRNGEFEVWDATANALLGRTDAILPVNIDPGGTARNLEVAATRLRDELAKRSAPVDRSSGANEVF
jgi:hypothetical protein